MFVDTDQRPEYRLSMAIESLSSAYRARMVTSLTVCALESLWEEREETIARRLDLFPVTEDDR